MIKMKSSENRPGKEWLPPTWLKLIVVVVLGLSLFFHFVHLDRKAYWIDEAYTSLRISGYTEQEFVREIADGKLREIQELQKYQRVNSQKSAIDTLRGLAHEEPQLTPLYFVIARYWAQWFGDAIGTTRSLAACFSWLALPALYWLCLELFQSSFIGWVALLIVANSPFQLIYAQEARPYSLAILITILSSSIFLRSVRLNRPHLWILYTLTTVLGLYTHLLFALVTLSHGIYLAILNKFRWSSTLLPYGLSTIFSSIALSPWLFILLDRSQNAYQKLAWHSLKLPRSILLKFWSLNIGLHFFDVLELESKQFFPYQILGITIAAIGLVLVAYSLYYLWSQAPRQQTLFILCLIGTTALALMPIDLVFGGIRSINTRYMIPYHLGISLSMSYLFAKKMMFPRRGAKQIQTWKLALISVISLGVLSCSLNLPTSAWWNKRYSASNLDIAQTINSVPEAVIISTLTPENRLDRIGNLLVLSHLCKEGTKLQLVTEPNFPKIPQGFKNIFLYSPSDRLQQELAKTFKQKTIYSPSSERLSLIQLI